MKNILVIGCAGFIGSHLCEKLLSNNYSVIGIDNFDNYYAKNIKEKNLKGFINNSNFTFLEVDILDKVALSNVPKINLVINLAAKAGVRPSIDSPLTYLKNNIEGTQNVLDFLVEKKIEKYVFASSSSIYGNTDRIPFLEKDECNQPISPYAYTKKAGEMMNYTYHNLYKIDVVNLRFFTVFGPRQRPDLAIHKFVNLIKSGKPIEMYGDGTTARDYTYIADIVDGITASIHFILKKKGIFESINIGNHYPITLKDLIATIYKVLNLPPNIVSKNLQKGEVSITFADITKAKKLLEYSPKTNFEAGIRKFVKWYEEK